MDDFSTQASVCRPFRIRLFLQLKFLSLDLLDLKWTIFSTQVSVSRPKSIGLYLEKCASMEFLHAQSTFDQSNTSEYGCLHPCISACTGILWPWFACVVTLIMIGWYAIADGPCQGCTEDNRQACNHRTCCSSTRSALPFKRTLSPCNETSTVFWLDPYCLSTRPVLSFDKTNDALQCDWCEADTR